jgi:hypothetical protein
VRRRVAVVTIGFTGFLAASCGATATVVTGCSAAVSGEATISGLDLSSGKFSGTFGSQSVTGTASLQQEGSNGLVITASMTVG